VGVSYHIGGTFKKLTRYLFSGDLEVKLVVF